MQDRWQVADFSGGGGGGGGGLKFGLCEVVWEWAKGTSFEEITKLTDVAEGTIVRVITRLDETCREVRDAARVIGDGELFKKMEDAQARIKRDSTCHFVFFPLACGSGVLTEFVQLCLLRVCISREDIKQLVLDSLRPAYYDITEQTLLKRLQQRHVTLRDCGSDGRNRTLSIADTQ